MCILSPPVGWSGSAQPVQQHAAEEPGQQVQLWQPLLGQLKGTVVAPRGVCPSPPWSPPILKALCVKLNKNTLPKHNSPSPTSLTPKVFTVSFFSLFQIGCTCKIFMYVFIYIYTVYVIVEHEMWLLHFIFERRFCLLFQNCRKTLQKYI